LKKQPLKRKILIVLSDGNPLAGGNKQKAIRQLKNNVARIEKSGVEVIGIGMGINVSQYYPKNIEINGTSGIAKTIYTELKRIFKV